jgi:hypothetical protein
MTAKPLLVNNGEVWTTESKQRQVTLFSELRQYHEYIFMPKLPFHVQVYGEGNTKFTSGLQEHVRMHKGTGNS